MLIAAAVFVGLLRAAPDPAAVEGTVADAYSGQPLGGLTLILGEQRATTDPDGRFTLRAVTTPTLLVLPPAAGYAGAEREIAPGSARGLTIALRPTGVAGAVVHAKSDAPLPGVAIRAVGPDGTAAAEATTGPDGRYQLAGVPEGARLIAEGPGFARREVEIGPRATLDLALRPDTLTGAVRGPDGEPLAGATVAVGGRTATTDAAGVYTLAGLPEEAARVAVKAPGYAPREEGLAATSEQDFALEPLVIKGIYLTPDSIIDDAKFNALLALADRTEINAMVLDFKDETGWLFHDSQVALAREIGAVHPRYDLPARLKTLKEHGIYTIARIVCMQDETLAKARPELAVRNSTTGGIWRNFNGTAWVNAMRPEVWRYNADVAIEAARLGFDEVQYDYVRFPSDGDMEAIDLGTANTMASRTEAVYQFLKLTHDALAPRGVPLAADIFGIALWDPHDNGIGQQLEKLAPVVDYLCPMIYPSHYYAGSMGFDQPNDHPYEVILESLEHGAGRIDNAKVKFRPWLQDFSYGKGIDYGPAEVRAQIQATYDFGATGWLLWNAANVFSEGALQPEGR